MSCQNNDPYFYGQQASQFSFYRVPKVLFTDERYRVLSLEARFLYGILLDRMELSMKNHWLDNKGRVYIIFTIEEVMAHLGCGDKKAGALLAELEKKAGLIQRKRQGLGKPNLIYVKKFIFSDRQIKTRQNHREIILILTRLTIVILISLLIRTDGNETQNHIPMILIFGSNWRWMSCFTTPLPITIFSWNYTA